MPSTINFLFWQLRVLPADGEVWTNGSWIVTVVESRHNLIKFVHLKSNRLITMPYEDFMDEFIVLAR